MGTSDPADVATIAYEHLRNNPKALHDIRSRLHQVILDEYQDVSVSQHQLLRLIINGIEDEKQNLTNSLSAKVPILMNDTIVEKRRADLVNFCVPNFCAAGDSNQSIYGWRGAAPVLTVDGFQKDFPQGIVVPLKTSYRLPRNILNAANTLMGRKLSVDDNNTGVFSFDISPAALKSTSLSLLAETHGNSKLDELRPRSQFLIQGLWDVREEAKFIASSIRKRARARINFAKNLLQSSITKHKPLESHHAEYDSADVAIMLRSSHEVGLFKEALEFHGVPYETPSEDCESRSISDYINQSQLSNIPMKPVKLITMHQAKGDEFDDIYLASWTEGNFPHPSSVLTNRLHEERRIAYVALTRARQKVIITYSFMTETAFIGPKGERKDVTEQVLPSRFLKDIMLDSRKDNILGVEWNHGVGFKEVISGKNLPSFFGKSYRIPDGYHSRHAKRKTIHASPGNDADKKEMLKIIEVGLQLIFDKKKGACNQYRPIFLDLLKKIGINRGNAVVARKDTNDSMYAVANACENQTTTRPISRCTSKELGLFLVYLLKNDESK